MTSTLPDIPPRYSEEIPVAAGYYVYRLWTADGTCLYVGRVGDSGPRSPRARLRHHRTNKTWWPDVAKIEVAELPDHPAIVAEEDAQIKALQPVHNIQRGNCAHDLSLPGAVKLSGNCRECAREYDRRFRDTPAGRAAKQESDRRRNPQHNAARRLRRRRPPSGQAPLW